MAIQISKDAAKDALREHLQALALPGWKQLRLFRIGETKSGLTKSIRSWSSQPPMATLIRSQKSAQREKLEQIKSLVRQVGRKDVDPYIFRNTDGHKECQEIRRLAAELLDHFGWPRKTPSKHSPFLEGLPAAQKAKSPQPKKPQWHSLKRSSRTKQEPVRLNYHQAICDLLDVRPESSKQNANRLRSCERRSGVGFPPAVSELFSLRHIDGIFCDNTNQDSLVEFAQLGKYLDTKAGVTYLQVATENQGVVTWHVPLGDVDDPPVFQAPDGEFSAAEIVSATFSNFVFDIIADNVFRGWATGLHLEGKASMPDQVLLRRLRRAFQEGPRTRNRNSTAYRFFTPDSVLRIVSNTPPDRAAKRGLWTLEAATSASLFEMAREVWHFSDVSKKVKAHSMSPESRSVGKGVLRQLRKL